MTKLTTLLDRLQKDLPKKRLLQKLQEKRSRTVLDAIQEKMNVEKIKTAA
ncbi:hypothetical protein [Flammeovirga pacifica]|nr:hypothetical protein [Flammeovirga pacifica]